MKKLYTKILKTDIILHRYINELTKERGMNYKITKGNYEKMGLIREKDRAIFTFAGEKEDTCFIVLVDVKEENEIRIMVPPEYCFGSLRSIEISGISMDKYLYYYEVNGKKYVDPYARGIAGREVWNDKSRADKNYKVYGTSPEMKFDWEEDAAPEIPKAEMIMYKLHVRGFTMDHAGVGRNAGTFGGVRNKIPYLKELGITTVEMMPVYEFEEMPLPVAKELPDYINWKTEMEDVIRPEETEEITGKLNYWGYSKGDYFAVKASYARNPKKAALEFKQLIKELHDNYMECVMEMFFPEDVNHNLVLDALRFWVREYHVDGFHLLGTNLPITAIAQDVWLSRTKIFYTDFQEGDMTRKGTYRNLYIYKDEYLYPVRKILNHMNGDLEEFFNQQRKQREEAGFVNYIANNNGFTLADVFMYNDKHNEDNGENNEDGNNWNFTSNYGVEGPTRKKYVASVRKKQWRNAMVMLMMAQGVPLIMAGDEFGNSQKGNNNAYCQDNAIGWVNWRSKSGYEQELEFLKGLIQLRKAYPQLTSQRPFRFQDYRSLGFPDASLHGDYAWISQIDRGRMSLGVMYSGVYAKGDTSAADLYIAYNFYSAPVKLALPKPAKKKQWHLALDSSKDKEQILLEEELLKEQQFVSVQPQSICILVGKQGEENERSKSSKNNKQA